MAKIKQMHTNRHISWSFSFKRRIYLLAYSAYRRKKTLNQNSGFFRIWSGKGDSNSRPQPWQGYALPTELFPHLVLTGAKINTFHLSAKFCTRFLFIFPTMTFLLLPS